MHFSAEQFSNVHRVAPEIILCLSGIVIMLLDPFLGRGRQRMLGW
jgi:hypothetical protein